MSGAAWNTKKKTPEKEWEELVIKKNEYSDILTTEECLIPTLEEYVKEQYELIKDTDRAPNGMCGHWGWRLEMERQYKKLFNK